MAKREPDNMVDFRLDASGIDFLKPDGSRIRWSDDGIEEFDPEGKLVGSIKADQRKRKAEKKVERVRKWRAEKAAERNDNNG